MSTVDPLATRARTIMLWMMLYAGGSRRGKERQGDHLWESGEAASARDRSASLPLRRDLDRANFVVTTAIMPNAALSAYLAKNYLDGAKAEAMLARAGEKRDGSEKKKGKKKRVDEGGRQGAGLRMVDDGEESWKQRQDSDEEAVVVVDEGEQKRKRAKWSKLGQDAIEEPTEGAEERPQMAGQDGLGLDSVMQDAVEQELFKQRQQGAPSENKSVIRAGLRTKEEMRAERLERERLAALQPPDIGAKDDKRIEDEARRKREREEKAQETVYRDASGRKIDVSRDDEEQRQNKEREDRREREKKDWNKGQAQLEAARTARRREEEEKKTSFARYSTDERMNQQLREIQRTSDPALGFLTKKQTSKGPQKPSYKGSFPPNRFHIRPGYRWDGVERSNGYEVKFFQRKHQRAQRKGEMDAWGKEDL